MVSTVPLALDGAQGIETGTPGPAVACGCGGGAQPSARPRHALGVAPAGRLPPGTARASGPNSRARGP
eukprot:13832750-Alexandrium_andersonii.AAC.1